MAPSNSVGLPPRRQFAHHRIDQKRHVVIADLDHGYAARRRRRADLDRLAGDPGSARLALLHEVPDARGKLRKLAGAVAHDVFGDDLTEQPLGEARGNLAALQFQRRARLRNRLMGCRLFGIASVDGCRFVDHN